MIGGNILPGNLNGNMFFPISSSKIRKSDLLFYTYLEVFYDHF